MRKGIITAILPACCTALLSLAGCEPPPPPTLTPTLKVTATPATAKDRKLPRAHKLLGEKVVKLLAGVSRVDTFRVSGKPPTREQAIIAGRAILYQGKPQGKAFATRLAGLLLNDKTYTVGGEFNPRHECLFEPFVAYRIWSGKEAVEVCVCFGCNEWVILTRSAAGIVTPRAYGSFGGAKKEVLALTRAAFPTDAAVRRLRLKN